MERMKPQVRGNESSIIVITYYWDFLQVSIQVSMQYLPPVPNRPNPLGTCRGHPPKHHHHHPKHPTTPHKPMHAEKQAPHSHQLFENLRIKCYVANLIFNFSSVGKISRSITAIFVALFPEKFTQSKKYCVALIQSLFWSVPVCLS